MAGKHVGGRAWRRGGALAIPLLLNLVVWGAISLFWVLGTPEREGSPPAGRVAAPPRGTPSVEPTPEGHLGASTPTPSPDADGMRSAVPADEAGASATSGPSAPALPASDPATSPSGEVSADPADAPGPPPDPPGNANGHSKGGGPKDKP